jgi:hypothetical protein
MPQTAASPSDAPALVIKRGVNVSLGGEILPAPSIARQRA